MKKFGFTVLCLILSNILVAPGDKTSAQPKIELAKIPKIATSTITEDLREQKKQHPQITSRELAEYGNKLLAQKGFNYTFDLCEFLNKHAIHLGYEKDSNNNEPFYKPFLVFLTTADRTRRSFQILANEGDAPCGECFSDMAAMQVTTKEITVLSEGKPVRLLRLKDFYLDEMVLVDKTLKKVIRRWEVPFQTEPDGISADGTKLYLEFSIEEESSDKASELVLELSADGKLQIRSREGLNLGKGKRLKNFPKDKNNAYLAYKRFRQGGKTFIIKFSEVCT